MSILDIFKGADINEGVKEFRADKNAVLLDVRSKEEYGRVKKRKFFMRPFYFWENTAISIEKEHNTPTP